MIWRGTNRRGNRDINILNYKIDKKYYFFVEIALGYRFFIKFVVGQQCGDAIHRDR